MAIKVVSLYTCMQTKVCLFSLMGILPFVRRTNLNGLRSPGPPHHRAQSPTQTQVQVLERRIKSTGCVGWEGRLPSISWFSVPHHVVWWIVMVLVYLYEFISLNLYGFFLLVKTSDQFIIVWKFPAVNCWKCTQNKLYTPSLAVKGHYLQGSLHLPHYYYYYYYYYIYCNYRYINNT